MSKAFTREDDPVDEIRPAPVSLLPPGVRNLVTPEGHARLQNELNWVREQRPMVVEGSLKDPELKRELAQIDQRLTYLERSLAMAEVVAPTGDHERVRFGSTVTIRDTQGQESTYRIVGVDEANFERHEVSWRSPIAHALLNARLGELVPFRYPTGVTQLEVLEIK